MDWGWQSLGYCMGVATHGGVKSPRTFESYTSPTRETAYLNNRDAVYEVMASRKALVEKAPALTGVTPAFSNLNLDDMAMPKKTFLNAEGQLVKKCQGDCGEVLPVDQFYTRVQAGKYTVYDSKCRKCKSAYNRKWTIGREKRSRKAITNLENTLESVRSVVIDWKEVIDFAMKHPLASGFKTPQEFVLSTLKTVYDGRPKTNL